MRLRLASPHPARADGSYEGPSGAWRVGDVREVDEATGAGLRSDFPGVFLDDIVPAVAAGADRELSGPPASGAMEPPPTRGPFPLPPSVQTVADRRKAGGPARGRRG